MASSRAPVAEAPPKCGRHGPDDRLSAKAFPMTPLELAGILSSIANGGTLYYLQYPQQRRRNRGSFTPRVKRTLEIAPNGIEDIKVGMRGAVDHGTARTRELRPQRDHFRQDRHLHGFPRRQPHGMVRLVHRSRQAPAGGGGDAHQPSEIGQRAVGFGRGRRVLQEPRGAALFRLERNSRGAEI